MTSGLLHVCCFYIIGSPIGRATCVEENGVVLWDWVIDCGGDKTTKQQLNTIVGVS